MEFLPYWPFVEFLSDWWLWGQILFWIYIGGVVINLVLFLLAGYQVCLYLKVSFANLGNRIGDCLHSVAWPYTWTWTIVVMALDPKIRPYPLHFVRAALGTRDSLIWADRVGVLKR